MVLSNQYFLVRSYSFFGLTVFRFFFLLRSYLFVYHLTFLLVLTVSYGRFIRMFFCSISFVSSRAFLSDYFFLRFSFLFAILHFYFVFSHLFSFVRPCFFDHSGSIFHFLIRYFLSLILCHSFFLISTSFSVLSLLFFHIHAWWFVYPYPFFFIHSLLFSISRSFFPTPFVLSLSLSQFACKVY